MIYNQGQHISLKHDESGHIEIKPTLLDYFKCMAILFAVYTLLYFTIQVF